MRALTFIGMATALAAGVSLAAQGAGRSNHGHGPASSGAAHPHAAGAIGRPADPRAATRTVEIVLDDIEFSPSEVAVRDGETVRFVLRNRGKLLHEFNIGTPSMHRAHQAEMQRMFEQGLMTPTGMPDHVGRMHGHSGGRPDGMDHDDPNSLLLEPGETGELVWTFERNPALEFACNVPGHYPAGMVGTFRFE